MQAVQIADILRQRGQTGQAWLEFLRVPSLSMGVYFLTVGSRDGQSPHNEDEIYYVLSGRASIRVADQEIPVEPGSIVFVGSLVEHRFFDITEDLTVLVFFAPAETPTDYSGGQHG